MGFVRRSAFAALVLVLHTVPQCLGKTSGPQVLKNNSTKNEQNLANKVENATTTANLPVNRYVFSAEDYDVLEHAESKQAALSIVSYESQKLNPDKPANSSVSKSADNFEKTTRQPYAPTSPSYETKQLQHQNIEVPRKRSRKPVFVESSSTRESSNASSLISEVPKQTQATNQQSTTPTTRSLLEVSSPRTLPYLPPSSRSRIDLNHVIETPSKTEIEHPEPTKKKRRQIQKSLLEDSTSQQQQQQQQQLNPQAQINRSLRPISQLDSVTAGQTLAHETWPSARLLPEQRSYALARQQAALPRATLPPPVKALTDYQDNWNYPKQLARTVAPIRRSTVVPASVPYSGLSFGRASTAPVTFLDHDLPAGTSEVRVNPLVYTLPRRRTTTTPRYENLTTASISPASQFGYQQTSTRPVDSGRRRVAYYNNNNNNNPTTTTTTTTTKEYVPVYEPRRKNGRRKQTTPNYPTAPTASTIAQPHQQYHRETVIPATVAAEPSVARQTIDKPSYVPKRTEYPRTRARAKFNSVSRENPEYKQYDVREDYNDYPENNNKNNNNNHYNNHNNKERQKEEAKAASSAPVIVVPDKTYKVTEDESESSSQDLSQSTQGHSPKRHENSEQDYDQSQYSNSRSAEQSSSSDYDQPQDQNVPLVSEVEQPDYSQAADEGGQEEKDLVEEADQRHDEHHKPEHHEAEEGGAADEEEHGEEEGDEGEKSYKEHHEHEEGKKGHLDKEVDKKDYEEKEGGEKEHHDEAGLEEKHVKGEKGEKGSGYHEKGKHDKGHNTKGEHVIHKKDEYEKKTEFYDEFHDSGEVEKHGGHHEEHHHEKGGKYKKGHHHEGHDEAEHGKKGKHKKGHHYHDHKGHKEEEADAGHHHHEERHGKKAGHGSAKKWKHKEER